MTDQCPFISGRFDQLLLLIEKDVQRPRDRFPEAKLATIVTEALQVRKDQVLCLILGYPHAPVLAVAHRQYPVRESFPLPERRFRHKHSEALEHSTDSPVRLLADLDGNCPTQW